MADSRLLAKVITKSWKDPAFKKKLLADPQGVLKEMGIEVSTDFNMNAAEDTSNG